MIPLLLSRRVAFTLLFLALTGFFSWFALNLSADPGAESVIPSQGEDLRHLREFNALFGSDEVIVLALHSDRLFSTEALGVMDDLARKAARLPHVVEVVSPTNARDLEGDELGPFSVVPYQKVLSGDLHPGELGRRLGSHPIYGGLLVSPDARSAALLIQVERVEGNPTYRRDLVRKVRELSAELGPGIDAYAAGIPVEKVDVPAYVVRDQIIFAPLILGILTVITMALYRHPAGVVVPLSVVVVSLIWTLGLYGVAGRSLNPVTSLMTPVVLVVSVAGAIHLINHYLSARAGGLLRPAALQRAFDLSKVPCFSAALTTAIGFGSLVLLPIPAIRDFGLFTAAGVMASYALTMTLAPLLLATLPDFPSRVAASFRPGRLERALKATAAWVGSHPWAAGATAVGVLALSLLGITRLRVETDLIHSLRPDSPLAQATRFIDRHLTGVNSLEILVKGVPPEDPSGLKRIERFEKEVRSLPGIRKVTALTDLYARVNRAFHEGNDAFATLPEGPGATGDLEEFRDLLEKDAAAELSRFVSDDGRTLRLAARVSALDTASSQRLFREIRDAAARAGLERVVLTGNFVVLSDMSTTLVRNQIRGLVPALALILAALMVQFRSVRLGLLSLIPIGTPLVMVYGLMGWIGIPLSVPTAMIASIAIGMTDDNTIHLMARFREAFRGGADHVTALAAMLDASGRGVVFSTVTVAVGLGVGAFSSFLPSVHFAVLTGAALLLGLLSDVVMLPLALVLFRPLGKQAVGPAAARRRAALVLLLPAAILAGGGWVFAVPAPPEIVLRDQFGGRDGPAFHRGDMVLLLYGRAAGLRRMRTWELRVREKAREEVAILRAVDARKVRGKKTEAEVSRRLRENTPPEIPVLIDWNGDLATRYALPDAEVAVTVIDPQGKSCGTEQGAVDRDTLGRVIEVLSRVRKEGRCP